MDWIKETTQWKYFYLADNRHLLFTTQNYL